MRVGVRRHWPAQNKADIKHDGPCFVVLHCFNVFLLRNTPQTRHKVQQGEAHLGWDVERDDLFLLRLKLAAKLTELKHILSPAA